MDVFDLLRGYLVGEHIPSCVAIDFDVVLTAEVQNYLGRDDVVARVERDETAHADRVTVHSSVGIGERLLRDWERPNDPDRLFQAVRTAANRMGR